ncbi:hypothetical protein GW17_00051960 [Ensete ventricosum]|nr:hypothetical protein GW17_00051960 [Ensete ventricosum]
MERPGGIMDEGVHMLDENKGKLVGLVLDFLLLARGSTPQGAPEGVYIRLCGSSLQPTVVRNATRIDPDGEEEEEAVDEPDRRITPTRCDADGLEAAGSAAFLWRRDAAAVGIPAVRQGDTRPPVGSPAAAVMDHEARSSGVYGYARRASVPTSNAMIQTSERSVLRPKCRNYPRGRHVRRGKACNLWLSWGTKGTFTTGLR